MTTFTNVRKRCGATAVLLSPRDPAACRRAGLSGGVAAFVIGAGRLAAKR